MNTKRIRISHNANEPAAPNTFPDFDWVREHRNELLATYGESVILVYEKQVIGVGKTIQEAVEDAEKRLPAEIEQVTPITEFLSHPYSFVFRPFPLDSKRASE